METLLDGSKIRANLQLANRLVAKSLLACTGIFGSKAAAECMLPHWQLPMSATEVEREKIQADFLTHIQSTRRQFGFEEERVFPTMIGMNKKEGMTNDEFDRYVKK
jgi:hypothetical protein